MKKSHIKAISILLSMFVATSLLTACQSKQDKCDELLNVLSYGPMSDSDQQWYDANCN